MVSGGEYIGRVKDIRSIIGASVGSILEIVYTIVYILAL